MKSKRILVLMAEILLFLSIAITFSWLFSPDSKELSFEETVIKLKNGEIKETFFKPSGVNFTDINGNRFYARISNDSARIVFLNEIKEFNKNHSKAMINYSEDARSDGWSWFFMGINVQFYIWGSITLLVIVNAVRTLSRNKG